MVVSPEPQLTEEWLSLKNGAVTLRSIRQQDFEAIKRFLSRLSPRSAYLRFHISSTDLAREKIIELTNIDHNREVAIVACDTEMPEEIRAVARYKRLNGSDVAEFGVVVEDGWQKRGLAKLMMTQLGLEARRMGVKTLIGYVLKGNEAMYSLMQSLGYTRHADNDDDSFILFTLNLN